MIQHTSRTGGRFRSPSSANELSIDHLDLLDERHVTIVEDAIAEGRIGYVINSTHAIGEPDRILYGECLPCLIERNGREHVNDTFVPALEALGAAPVLDRHMLRLVLDKLDSNSSAFLGCSLSADNLSDPETWAHIRNQIAARSNLAPRLILDIDATSPFADIALASDLLSEARKFGFRVALSSFGHDHAADRHALGLDADIVKIDAPLAVGASADPDHLNKLAHMVSLAAGAARVVVVEGVETPEQLEIARLAGATHVRGDQPSEPIFPLLADGSKGFGR